MSDKLEIGMALAGGVGIIWGRLLYTEFGISTNIFGSIIIVIALIADIYVDYQAND